MKAKINREGQEPKTIDGTDLIDLVEKVMMDGGKGVTMVEIIREEHESLRKNDNEG